MSQAGDVEESKEETAAQESKEEPAWLTEEPEAEWGEAEETKELPPATPADTSADSPADSPAARPESTAPAVAPPRPAAPAAAPGGDSGGDTGGASGGDSGGAEAPSGGGGRSGRRSDAAAKKARAHAAAKLKKMVATLEEVHVPPEVLRQRKLSARLKHKLKDVYGRAVNDPVGGALPAQLGQRLVKLEARAAALRKSGQAVPPNMYDEFKGLRLMTAVGLHQAVSMLGYTLPLEEAREILRLIDHDADGLIGFDEFFAGVHARLEQGEIKAHALLRGRVSHLFDDAAARLEAERASLQQLLAAHCLDTKPPPPPPLPLEPRWSKVCLPNRWKAACFRAARDPQASHALTQAEVEAEWARERQSMLEAEAVSAAEVKARADDAAARRAAEEEAEARWAAEAAAAAAQMEAQYAVGDTFEEIAAEMARRGLNESSGVGAPGTVLMHHSEPVPDSIEELAAAAGALEGVGTAVLHESQVAGRGTALMHASEPAGSLEEMVGQEA